MRTEAQENAFTAIANDEVQLRALRHSAETLAHEARRIADGLPAGHWASRHLDRLLDALAQASMHL